MGIAKIYSLAKKLDKILYTALIIYKYISDYYICSFEKCILYTINYEYYFQQIDQ